MVTMPIEIYSDGSSLSNPGASGLGYVIHYWEDNGDDLPKENTIECSQGFRLSTNNRMEITAAVWGIRAVITKINDGTFQGASQINLYSDSEYFVKSINSKWIEKWKSNNWMTSGFGNKKPTPVKNKDLWESLIAVQDELRAKNISLIVTHVEGHSDNVFNNRADELAVAGSNNSSNHIVDEGYEKNNDNLNRR